MGIGQSSISLKKTDSTQQPPSANRFHIRVGFISPFLSMLRFCWLDFMCAAKAILNSCGTFLTTNTCLHLWFLQSFHPPLPEDGAWYSYFIWTWAPIIPESACWPVVSLCINCHAKRSFSDESCLAHCIYGYKIKNLEHFIIMLIYMTNSIKLSPRPMT